MADEKLVVELVLDGEEEVSKGLADTAKQLQAVTGPAQRLEKAMQDLAKVQGMGNPAQQFDAHFRALQAQKSYGRAYKQVYPPDPPGFGSKLSSALMSSRISMSSSGGVQLMPLVNRILPLLGAEAMAVTAGFATLAIAANSTAQAVKDFRSAMFTGGGSAGETAQAGALGSGLGFSAQDAAGMARDLSNTISQGGAAAAVAGKAGVHDFGAFDKVDKMQDFLKIADMIANEPYAEALRDARLLHQEQLLGLRDLSGKTRKQLESDAQMREQMFGSQSVQNAAEFNAQWGRLQDSFGDFKNQVLIPMLPAMSKLMEVGTGFVHIVGMLEKGASFLGPLQTLGRLLGLFGDKGNAMEKNTKAIEENTYAVKNGVFGNGASSAKGAIPANWHAFNSGQWAGEAARLGAFSL